MTYKPVDTAIVMLVGPCIDDTDFKTLEEAIAYDAAGMDVSLIVEKTDGTTAVTAITLTTGGTSDWTHKDGGYYEVEITAAQNAEEGIAFIRGVCTGVLPFESIHYNIVTANVYDSLIKGTDKLQIDAVEISGDSTAADNAELAFDGTGYGFTNCTVPTVTTLTGHTAQTGDSFARIGATGSGLTSLAAAATALTNATWTDLKAGYITGTVALQSVCTETRLAELDAANLPTDIADIPTVAEFEARTIAAADYVVTADTIAGVTTTTNLTNAPTNGDLTATMKTSVNDQVVDVIKTDTTSEMSQSAPPATPTIEEMLAYAYFKMRNKQETTSTEDAIYNNTGDTKLFKSVLSDDGTTFSKQEYGTGA